MSFYFAFGETYDVAHAERLAVNMWCVLVCITSIKVSPGQRFIASIVGDLHWCLLWDPSTFKTLMKVDSTFPVIDVLLKRTIYEVWQIVLNNLC